MAGRSFGGVLLGCDGHEGAGSSWGRALEGVGGAGEGGERRDRRDGT